MNKIRILFKKKNGAPQRSGESSINDGQMSCEKLCPDRPEWPICSVNMTLPELMEQIDYISGLIKNIYENSQITIYDKTLQERVAKGRQELELLENEVKFLNRNINAQRFQINAVKEEKVKLIKLIPMLMEDEKKETDQVLQRYDVFLHARWGVLKHSKNAKKLESFLVDIKKRHLNLVNMEKNILHPPAVVTPVKPEPTKPAPVVPPETPATPKSKPPATLNINPLNIKRIPRPYKRRRQQEAPLALRNPMLAQIDNKNGIVLYPIEELERQQRIAAQLERQQLQQQHQQQQQHTQQNFNSVVLPIEYVDLTGQDLQMNAPMRTEPGQVNRDSTSNTSLSSNIHSEISCMMQALFGESASTTSINLDNLNANNHHAAMNGLFLSDNEPNSDTDFEDPSSSNR